MNTKIESNLKNNSANIIEKIHKNVTVDREFALRYIPFLENDVILIQSTDQTIFLLLKNGTVISFIPEGNKNIINIFKNRNKLFPRIIKIPTKIIDLSCGYDHCLALGLNGKVYSWGSNSCGQLSLPDVFVTNEARKEEPSEIPIGSFLRSNKIMRVFANNNSSYAISENNYLYGWGIINIEDAGSGSIIQKIIKSPTILDLIPDNFTIFVGRKKIYLNEYETKPFEIGEIIEFNKSKSLYSVEQEKRQELEKLKFELSQFKKVRSSNEDYEILINEIENVILKMKDKINKIEMKRHLSHGEDYDKTKNVDTFTKELEYFSEKSEMYSKERIKDILTPKEKAKFKHQSITNLEMNENDRSEDNYVFKEIQTFRLNTKFLYDKVKKEIEYLRNNKINLFWKSDIDKKLVEKKKKNLKDFISIFQSVIHEIKLIIENQNKKDSIKNLNKILEEIKSEFPNIKMNRIATCISRRKDENYVLDNLEQSDKNYEKMEEKLSNMIWNKNNTYISSILDMVKSNITLSKQNNILFKKISNYSRNYYNSLYQKIVTNDNPEYFNELTQEIGQVKQNYTSKSHNKIMEESELYSELNLDTSF